MKIATVRNPVQSSGIAEQNTFTIAVTAKMFDDLMDKRYPDKPKAIIRELSANARDGLDAAGKKSAPFEVRLPTQMMPRLQIIDHGTGMDHDFVMRRYSCVGDSVKDKNNAVIGGFGVGSKVGFAVSDMFTVESRYNGKKRTYTCFRDAARLPSIALTTTVDTIEPNGVTVDVPVEIGDIAKWHEAAKKVLPYFDPPPKCNIKMEPIEYVMRQKDWGVRKRSDDYYTRQHEYARVIMGSIPYPVDPAQISDATGFVYELLRKPIDLFLPIGSVEILTNREGLEYDKAGKTAAAIKRGITRVANEIPTLYQKEIDACKTLWEARIKFKETVSGAGWEHNTLDKFRKSIKFKGAELLQQLHMHSRPGLSDLCHLGWRELRKSKLSLATKDEIWLNVEENLTVVLDDLSTEKPVVRLKYAIDQKKFPGDILVIRGTDPAKILEIMGDPPQIRMQDLDEPPKSVTTVIRSNVQPVTKWTTHSFYDHSYDVVLGGFYVGIDHRNAMRGETVVGNSYLNEVKDKAEELGIRVAEVYGIPRTHKNVPKRNPGWTNYFDHVVAEVTKLIEAENLSQQIADFEEMEKFYETALDDVVRLLANHNLRPTKARSKMAKLIEAYAGVKAGVPNLSRFKNLRQITERLGIEIKPSKPFAELVKLSEEAAIQYPLLKRVHSCISANADSECAGDIMEYVNLKD